jgi:hypothetical protein
MAKMLRNAPNRANWTCRCRQCRTSDQRGCDSMARRNQRARERSELRRTIHEETS